MKEDLKMKLFIKLATNKNKQDFIETENKIFQNIDLKEIKKTLTPEERFKKCSAICNAKTKEEKKAACLNLCNDLTEEELQFLTSDVPEK